MTFEWSKKNVKGKTFARARTKNDREERERAKLSSSQRDSQQLVRLIQTD